MIDVKHSLAVVAVLVVTNTAIRFIPFAVFKKKTPKIILYLSEVLPFAVMGMLIVYCLRNVEFVTGSHGIPELIAIAITAGLYKWRHNTLLAIIAGTVSYMLLVQLVF